MVEDKKCQIDDVEFLFDEDLSWKEKGKLEKRRKRALNFFSQNRDPSIDPSKMSDVLDLQPGEIVEVRSEKEILSTLDKARYKGMSFMPEMLKHCGKKLKVLKRAERIIVEGPQPRAFSPKNTVILEGTFCDGSWHGGCDRTCLFLWREKWLKRVESADS